ncbi:SGNH/GDSL hydrolase family protein [uncultured Sphingomonas sp.]|uniref:SGNH/GDSL hydrolase family protein n=1 Tax=uncultured Sphingomonas sp. TaxID=158754 RepID=UPI0025DF6C1A|nr:SGNH/GDSL hydrolase family protein [uncultured Sphingomonas sp.]
MPDTKISALSSSGPLTGQEMLPLVQGGQTVRGSIGVLLAEAARRADASNVVIVNDGDSKGQELQAAARWALARQPRNVRYGASINVGSSTTGDGTFDVNGETKYNLTHPTRLAAAVQTITDLTGKGFQVDVWMKIGTNDLAAASPVISHDAILANVKKAWNLYQAAGARFLILHAVDPRTSFSSAQRIITLNRLYSEFAQSTPGVFFLDLAAQLVDPTSATDAPLGGSTGGAFAVMVDGLHQSEYGFYRSSFGLAPLLQRLYTPLPIDLLHRTDAFSATATRGNLLGTVGRMVALGGTDSSVKSGTGTVTGTPPNGWELTSTTTLTGDLGITFTQAACAALDTHMGSSGSQCVNMALSGTPTADGSIRLRRTVLTSSGVSVPAGTPLIGEALVNFSALQGLHGFTASGNANAGLNGSTELFGVGAGGGKASSQFPALTGLHFFNGLVSHVPVATKNITTFNADFIFSYRAGVPLSGSIDLIQMAWRAAFPLPAAAA